MVLVYHFLDYFTKKQLFLK